MEAVIQASSLQGNAFIALTGKSLGIKGTAGLASACSKVNDWTKTAILRAATEFGADPIDKTAMVSINLRVSNLISNLQFTNIFY